MNSIDDLFGKFGGPAAVGRAIGVTTEHAAQMKRRKSIPVRWWPTLIAAAKSSGFDLTEADLVALHVAHDPFVKAGADAA